MSLLESEMLFLNLEAGAYELEGDIASTTLPTSLSESIRLRLAKVRSAHSYACKQTRSTRRRPILAAVRVGPPS